MSSIVHFDRLNLGNLVVNPLKKAGNTSVPLRHNLDGSEKRIMLFTPKMRLPFGVNGPNPAMKIEGYSMNMSFDGHASDESISRFLDLMRAFDSKILDIAEKKCPEWFKRSYSREVLETLFKPTVRESQGSSASGAPYAPTMKVKIPQKRNGSGEFDCQFWFEDQRPATIGDVTPGCYVEAIIEAPSIWFVNTSFGCSWSLVQLKIYAPERPRGYAFPDAAPAKPAAGLPAPAEAEDA